MGAAGDELQQGVADQRARDAAVFVFVNPPVGIDADVTITPPVGVEARIVVGESYPGDLADQDAVFADGGFGGHAGGFGKMDIERVLAGPERTDVVEQQDQDRRA